MSHVLLSRDFAFPLDVVTETVAILAKRRAGKSYLARKLVEGLLQAEAQVVIVDPKGDWFGLRSSADGKKPGYPVLIAGGEHGDVPLEPGGGEVLARFVVEQRVNLLLDLSSFRKYEVATFMTGFLEALYRLKAREEFRTPMMLAIDEADAVAPQRPQKGEERMLGAAEDIVRRGGQRGIGCTLISQRSAVLNKNVLTQAQVLIALRTMSPQDLAALDAWIEVHGSPAERKILFDSLPSLPVGDAWVWSPGWPTSSGIFQRIHVAPIETFDSGATPKVGQKVTPPKSVAEVDLGALKDSMAATIARAKADDPRELRKRIADLERQLAQHPTEAKVETRVERVEVPVLPPDTAAELRLAAENAMTAGDKLMAVGSLVIRALNGITTNKLPPEPLSRPAGEYSASGPKQPVARIDPVPRAHQRPPPTSPAPRPQQAESQTGSLRSPQQKILNVLGTLEDLGLRSAHRSAVGAFAGYSFTSGNFQNLLGQLRARGLIDYPSGNMVGLTDAGRTLAGRAGGIDTLQDLHAAWYDQLGGPRSRLLRVLIESYPDAVSREELGERTGYSPGSGNFQNLLGSMRTLGLVEYPAPGMVSATELLFPPLRTR